MSPRLDLDAVGFEHAHQLVVADGFSLSLKMVMQFDHHAAALRAVLGEVLDAERLRFGAFEAVPSSDFFPEAGTMCSPARNPL